jgi:hypothetical protein
MLYWSRSSPQNAPPVDTTVDNGMTFEQIAHAARTALPQGISLPEIDQYFAQNQVEHSFYKPTNQVFAAIRDIKGGFFPISKDAQIIITLDDAERLATIEVKPIFTGP